MALFKESKNTFQPYKTEYTLLTHRVYINLWQTNNEELFAAHPIPTHI